MKERQSSILYFQFKNKYDYSFTQEEKNEFQFNVLKLLESNMEWKNAKNLIIPETSNLCLIELAQKSNKVIHILKKNNKEDIKKYLESQFMQKTEKEKLFKIVNASNTLKMADIPGNQRKRFVGYLFEDLAINMENAIFLDDSVFSGYTFLAAQEKLKHIKHKNIILFDKTT